MVIYTIGHSNVHLEEIVKLLKKHGIEILLDVRSSPYSRFAPQFNRETLAESLWKAGIQYDYAGRHLGGRRRDRNCHNEDDEDKLLYKEVEKRGWYQEAIDGLIEVATEQ